MNDTLTNYFQYAFSSPYNTVAFIIAVIAAIYFHIKFVQPHLENFLKKL